MTAVIRSALFLLLAALITIPAGLLVCLAIVLPERVRFAIIAVWREAFLAICAGVLGLRYRVVGRENLPAEAAVVLAKHQSAWETVGLQAIFPHFAFVMKRSLLWIPFLGWGLGAARMISIDRGAGADALRQVVEQGRRRLAAGASVIVFPEGTRMAPGETRRYKSGGAQLAVSAGARVVPIAHNAGEFWARNAFVKRPGLITVSIGPAIDAAGKTTAEVNALAEQWIEGEMRRLSPHRYPDAAHVVAA